MGTEKCPVGTPATGLPGPQQQGLLAELGGARRWPGGQCVSRTRAPGEDTSCPALWASPGRVQILRAGAAHPVKTEFPLPFRGWACGQGAGRATWSPAHTPPKDWPSREPQARSQHGHSPASRSQHKHNAHRPVESAEALTAPGALPGPGGSARCGRFVRRRQVGGGGQRPGGTKGAAALSRVPSPPGAAPRGPGLVCNELQPPWAPP